MIELYALNIEEIIDHTKYDFFMKCISDSKREQIGKFHYISDKKRSLYADVLVRYLICQKFNITNSSIKFHTNVYGKPYYSDNAEFYFSIAHSNKWIFLGVSNNEIGVDIEYISDCRLDIAKHFFTTEEYEDLISTLVPYRSKLFYDIWCLKESYAKYRGIGLSIKLDSFKTKIIKDSSMIFTNYDEKIYVKHYAVDPNYSAAACSIEQPPNMINFIKLDKICKYMNLRTFL